MSQQNILNQALEHHRAGRLTQAEALYKQILSVEPNNSDTLLFLGMLAHLDGRIEMAVELMRKSIVSKPNYVEAYFNLGNALKDQGKLDEAVATYHQAISLSPNFAELHINLGAILKEQNKLNEAIISFRQALSLKPDSAMTHYNLGNALIDQGKLDEAVASYRQAISLKPDYTEVFYNLGKALTAQGKLYEAITSYKQAISLRPDFAVVYNNLGILFNQLGKMDDAISCFRKALSLKPNYLTPFKNLSLIVKFTQVDDFTNKMAEIFSKKGEISNADRLDLGFALGKIYEDIGDYNKSFEYILEANRLKRRSYKYSILNDQVFFERIKKTFTTDFFASHYGLGNQDKTPIFILGMPRSGTTLVEQILASHPQIFGAGELKILSRITNSICLEESKAQFPECLQDVNVGIFKIIGTDYIEKIRKYSEDEEYITDKMPSNFLFIGLIKTILPNSKIIHCIRNPMDNCFSIFKKGFTASHDYAYDLTELGQYYTLYLDLMAHWERVLPGFIYTLKYEEMVLDQYNQTKSLLEFCGISWDEACLTFYKTERRVSTASLAQVRQPIYKDSIELWKRYEKQLEPLKRAIYGNY